MTGDLAAHILVIQQLLAHYCRLVDDAEFDRLGEVFSPTAVVTIAGMQSVSVSQHGREEIISFIAKRQTADWRGKHILSVPIVECKGNDATVISEVIFVNRSRPGEPLQVATTGRYADTLERHDGQWRITERFITMFADR